MRVRRSRSKLPRSVRQRFRAVHTALPKRSSPSGARSLVPRDRLRVAREPPTRAGEAEREIHVLVVREEAVVEELPVTRKPGERFPPEERRCRGDARHLEGRRRGRARHPHREGPARPRRGRSTRKPAVSMRDVPVLKRRDPGRRRASRRARDARPDGRCSRARAPRRCSRGARTARGCGRSPRLPPRRIRGCARKRRPELPAPRERGGPAPPAGTRCRRRRRRGRSRSGCEASGWLRKALRRRPG